MPTKNFLSITRIDAIKIVRLISDRKQWIDRKVETIVFNQDGTSRRSLSFDFQIPPLLAKYGYVPITTLTKKPLRSLDVRSSSGESRSTLKLEDNADIAVNLMASGIAVKNLTDLNLQFLTEIVKFEFHSPIDETQLIAARNLLSRYNNLIIAKNREDYINLAQKFLAGFLFWVSISEDIESESKAIIKISYEERVFYHHNLFRTGRFKPLAIRSRINPTESMSNHFEVRAPLGLLVAKNEVKIQIRPGISRVKSYDAECPTQISHVAIRNSEDRNVFVDYKIIANRQGVGSIIFWAAALVICVFWLPLLIKNFDEGIIANPGGGNTVPLLVLGPALLITYLARPVEHGLVSSRMFLGRFALMFSGALLVLAAVALSGIIVSQEDRRLVWLIGAYLSVISLILAVFWHTCWTVSSRKVKVSQFVSASTIIRNRRF